MNKKIISFLKSGIIQELFKNLKIFFVSNKKYFSRSYFKRQMKNYIFIIFLLLAFASIMVNFLMIVTISNGYLIKIGLDFQGKEIESFGFYDLVLDKSGNAVAILSVFGISSIILLSLFFISMGFFLYFFWSKQEAKFNIFAVVLALTVLTSFLFNAAGYPEDKFTISDFYWQGEYFYTELTNDFKTAYYIDKFAFYFKEFEVKEDVIVELQIANVVGWVYYLILFFYIVFVSNFLFTTFYFLIKKKDLNIFSIDDSLEVKKIIKFNRSLKKLNQITTVFT